VTLNRPKALNALCVPLIAELNTALRYFESDSSIHTIVLTGSEKAFAAGADIKEMAPLTFSQAYMTSFIDSWSELNVFLTKPLIAAVWTFPTWDGLINGTLDTAEAIAGHSRVAVKAAKEVVNKSQELPLRSGIEYERSLFYALFGSQDQKSGMKAFIEKKKPQWDHK
jgi:enoyl-CoA hydratase/carnithine racemase